MKHVLYVLMCLIFLLAASGCDALRFRPEYPATFTPPPPSPTNPVMTLAAFTPQPTPTMVTATPRPDGLNTAWAINPFDRVLINIDPVSRKVLYTVKIEGVPVALSVGEGAIWVIERVGRASSNIIRIDPFSRLAANRIPITAGEAVSILAAGGSVWVSVAGEFKLNESPDGGVEFSRVGAVVRIDPTTNQVTDTIDINALAADLQLEGESLWVLGKKKSYSFINKLDITSGALETFPESILNPDYIHRFNRFTKLNTWLWMTPQDSSLPYIFRVSSVDGIVNSSMAVGSGAGDAPVELTAYNEQVWVALHNGTVLAIDPVLKKVEMSIETPARDLSDLFFTAGYLWVVSYGSALVAQIDPQTGDVVETYSTGNTPPPTPSPSITPTADPNQIWALCEQAFPTFLRAGIEAVVNRDIPLPTRVRANPSIDALILGYVEPGERVEILRGPVCQDGWVWWNISYADTELTGWASEGNGSEYWLLPLD